MKRILLLFLFSFSIVLTYGQSNKLTRRLVEKLESVKSDDYVRTLVILNDQVDVAAMDEMFYAEKASIERRTLEVITALKKKAATTQKKLLTDLAFKESMDEVFRYQPMWIVNMVMVEAKPAVIYELAAKSEIQIIDEDGLLKRDMPKEGSTVNESIEGVEDGVKIINSHKLWEMGITGAGRIVMGMDTGIDPTHPALSHKYRGRAGSGIPESQTWIDPKDGSTSPNDCDGHGTHTMGTMTGYSMTTNDTVGVAIDAEWIAAKTICSSPHTSYSVQAFQWAMDPDGDSTTINDMPDAICNSWYDPNIGDECTSIYVNTFNAVEAVGIAVVFSAGNSGSGASTITKPKNINTNLVNSWATAAIDGPTYLGGSNDPITSFSSRGPSICGGTGSLLIKPEASAPGNNVRSAVPGGGYGSKSGTSMAAPHVVGAIALLRQFAPNKTGTEIKLALYHTAKDLGAPGEDNTYGMGLIDVYAAMLILGTPDVTPPDPIVDLSSANITSNGLTLNWTAPNDTSLGGITKYDVRYSTTMISDSNDFANATELTFSGFPGDPGAAEALTVEDLDFNTTYYFAVRSSDVWGNWSDISNVEMGKTLFEPEISTTPASIGIQINNAAVEKDTIFISNSSDSSSTLDYTVSLQNHVYPEDSPVKVRIVPVSNGNQEVVEDKENPTNNNGMSLEGSGGPDTFGYEWIDSDETGGPVYEWNDISTTGTAVTGWQSSGSFGALDEGYAGPYSLGFPFKFYGNIKNEIYVATNGVILFGTISSNIFTNKVIPTAGTPDEFIAPFWDDLDGSDQGNVYYLQDGNKFIIQYDNWQKYNTTSSLNFQVVLHSTGKIVIYYKTMTGSLTSCTVGIENADGTDGLQVVNNGAFVKNEFALQFMAEPDWIAADNINGRIYNGNTVGLELTLRAEDYPAGDYSMDVVIESNDPANASVTVPVTMEILTIPVELTSFEANVHKQIIELVWNTATETNNQGFEIERKLNEESGWEKIGFRDGKINSIERSVYNFEDSFENISFTGKAQYRLKQIDLDGTFAYSNQIEVDVDFAPSVYALEQNYPNPFNPATTIKYSLPAQSSVKLTVYTMLGEVVTELVNEVQETGYYQIQWDASNLSSGVYIYTLDAQSVDNKNDFRSLKKMLLIK